jgi:hypothetical protein
MRVLTPPKAKESTWNIKENNHKQMQNVYYHVHYKNLLHVSTPPGHLQEEQFLYTMAVLI